MKFEFKKFTHIVSADMLSEHYDNPEHAPHRREHVFNSFMRRAIVRELLQVWSERYNLNGFVIVEAHGTAKPWRVNISRTPVTVQKIVNRLDGSKTAIMFFACNPRHEQISSRTSIVMHYNQSFRSVEAFSSLDWNKHHMTAKVYVPGEGYVESDYRRLRRIINRLRIGD